MTTTQGTDPADFEFFAGQETSFGDPLFSWRSEGVTVRHIRGSRCTTVEAMWDEFAAALQFPLYNGRNWAAFDESLSDLIWLPGRQPFVLAIAEADRVLIDDDAHDFGVLVRCLQDAVAWYAKPIETGNWFDRPAIIMRVLLQAEPGVGAGTRERWEAAGARLRPLLLD